MLLKREHSLLNCLKTLSVGPTRVWTPDLLHGRPILKQLSQLVGRLPCSGQNMYNRALDFGIKHVVDGETLPWPRVDTWNLFHTEFPCITSQLVQQYRNSPFSCLKYSSRTLIIALVSIIFCQLCIYILEYWTYPLIFLFIINRAQQYLQKSREWWGVFFWFCILLDSTFHNDEFIFFYWKPLCFQFADWLML